MSEFEELFKDELFVIDSNNLNSYEKNFYGYAIVNNKIIFEIDDFDLLDGTGAYIAIQETEDNITILQDFNGSYGLYLYQDDDYFALSNSFMKLVEYLKNEHELTLNKDYVESFLFSDLCSLMYKETLVDEIEFLPRNLKIIIDKTTKSIDFEKIDYHERTVPLDSKEAFEILDNWYYKWVNIIRSLKKETNNISVDLSGGFDSRIISVLWITANIDLDKIRIKSHDDNLHGHQEDYYIASKIAKDFNFKLNNNILSYNKDVFKEILTPIDISFYTKLGFHKQMYYKFSRARTPVYTITGEGGGPINGFLYKTKEETISQVMKVVNKSDTSLASSTYNVITKSINEIAEEYNIDENSKILPETYYREIRNRHHFGKAPVETRYSNWITLAPLIDSNLHKLDIGGCECETKAVLLYSLMFFRYCPKLLNYEFEGNREISPDVIEYTKRINEKYPFEPKELDFISGPDLDKSQPQLYINPLPKSNIENFLTNVFYSNKFKSKFLEHFSKTAYYRITKTLEEFSYHPFRHVFSAIAILKVINDIENPEEYKDMNEWLTDLNNDTSNDISPSVVNKLIKFNTARVDIQNTGNENNSIEIVDSSESRIVCPDWFKTAKGTGLVIESIQSPLDLKVKCINDGELIINLRGIDFRDSNREKFPIYIDFTKFTINDEAYVSEHTLVTHDKNYRITKDVKDSEILNIHVEWDVINDLSSYDSLEKKIIELRNKNIILSNELDDVFNSNSWKLTSYLRKIGRIFK